MSDYLPTIPVNTYAWKTSRSTNWTTERKRNGRNVPQDMHKSVDVWRYLPLVFSSHSAVPC
ncbi:hypothetical protein SCLCIDRAFT_693200 [Scleroderma citrinum Foug A]|uniref:Uncharacterized protein n=1 Tax=Scleroderma citrinum Foug A TaxID=1036808 RepID=A0A0C3D3N3_9AGAM|nr:hypothetical protein SCLCIDRAFT_693200 [Scleroderma citrinum Foug A]